MALSSVGRGEIVVDAVGGSQALLKIRGYSRTKGLSNSQYINSGTFVVGGHGWYIRYYPDGFGSTNAGWISLFLHLENSRSATQVQARFRFSLLLGGETGEAVPSYTMDWCDLRTIRNTDSAHGWGCQRFIQRKDLEGSSYLKDDCFRVRCELIISGKGKGTKMHFVSVPPPDLHEHIGRLLSASSQVEPDVTFQVGMETVAAHRLVLAARSPVFMAQLFGPMKEDSIRVDDMEAQVFKAMLHYIYTDSLPYAIILADQDEALVMAQHLLVAADRYDIQRLKLMCEDELCNHIDATTVAANLALAEQHGCCTLKEVCFQFLSSPGNLKAIVSDDGFQHLTSSCPSLLKDLLLRLAP